MLLRITCGLLVVMHYLSRIPYNQEKMAAREGASLLMALDASWGIVRGIPDMSAVVEGLMRRPKLLRCLPDGHWL